MKEKTNYTNNFNNELFTNILFTKFKKQKNKKQKKSSDNRRSLQSSSDNFCNNTRYQCLCYFKIRVYIYICPHHYSPLIFFIVINERHTFFPAITTFLSHLYSKDRISWCRSIFHNTSHISHLTHLWMKDYRNPQYN